MTVGFTTVSASRVKDATNTLIASAVLECQPCDSYGNPLTFPFLDGSATPSPTAPTSVYTTLTAPGAFSITLVDGSIAKPANVGYNFIFTNPVTGKVILFCRCVQWPTGTAFDFDTWQANAAPIAIVQIGPTGLPGPPGDASIANPAGSLVFADTNGSGDLYTITIVDGTLTATKL